jgi:hypothetical protein
MSPAGALLVLFVTLPQDGALDPLPRGAVRVAGWLAQRLAAAERHAANCGVDDPLAPPAAADPDADVRTPDAGAVDRLLRELRGGASVDRVGDGRAAPMLRAFAAAAGASGLPEDARDVLLRAHADVVARRLWPTGSGSVGGRWNRDGQWPDGPHDEVADTCVTAAWLEWNAQLLRSTGVASFAEEVERTAWNHLFAAQQPAGEGWGRFTPLRGHK